MELSKFKKMFEKMESEYELFYLKYNDVFWWDLVRYKVYYLLYDEISGTGNTELNRVNSRKISTFIKLFINELKYKYLLSKNKYEYMFYACSRERDSQGYVIDNISKDILSQYRNKSIILESFASIEDKSNYESYFNFGLVIKRIISRRRIISVNTDINEVIKDVFNINVDISDLVNETVKRFIIEREYYNAFLKKNKPKIIFMVQNGIQKGLIYAANELSIPLVELQHGLINQFHAAYNYSNEINYDHLNTFPNYLFTFSKYWHSINLPKTIELNIGNNANYFEKVNHNNKIGLIFSKKYSKALIDLTKHLLNKWPEKSFIVKLHPNQGDEVSYLREILKDNKNVEVIYNEKNTKDILEEIESIILVQSTVIYQALQSGCKAYIYKTQDYEIQEDLFSNKNVYLFDNLDDLTNKIDNEFVEDSNIFFDKFNEERLAKFVNAIKSNDKEILMRY